ncbi:hypothetical protein Tsubulata_045431 [Turnera subulata]|uniref:Maltose excess protein 1 n=1 Tax=Turnera subulata TaxID=218843 RepID=A0A9Q0FAY0_9ROSI|nr:hypothetical protein Tsubulata_045431 [Turnera subulata]
MAKYLIIKPPPVSAKLTPPCSLPIPCKPSSLTLPANPYDFLSSSNHTPPHSHSHSLSTTAQLHRRRLVAPAASSSLHSDAPLQRRKNMEEWDFWTAKFSGAANFPFLLLQLPQIILNAQNLLAGNKTALLAVPWLGMLTGLLGNLSLLSYFVKKRESEVIVVQTLGVISQFIVFAQLAMAEAMPWPYFIATSVVVGTGLLSNFLNYFGMLNPGLWRFWEDFITVGGLSALPQVMWSTFVPYIPNSILPGAVAFIIAVAAVVMARTGKLSEKGVKFVGATSGWTATLLFMWMPVSQMWTNFLNPENIKGLSAFSMLLAMIGNGLMIPRALFTRDLMWFTGSTWASLFYGYGNILCMYCFKSISKEFFFAATAGLISWIGCPFAIMHVFFLPFTSILIKFYEKVIALSPVLSE